MKKVATPAKTATPKQPVTAGKARRIKRGETIGDLSGGLTGEYILKDFNQQEILAQDNVFYSSYQPEQVFEALIEQLQSMDVKPELVPQKFKLTYEQAEELDDEYQKLGFAPKAVRMQVKITEIDEMRIAVEFIKL